MVEVKKDRIFYDQSGGGITFSGGEPLYSTSDVLKPFDSEAAVDYSLGVRYWLTFFMEFDEAVEKLKDARAIHLVDQSAWNWNRPFPSVLHACARWINT